jgi:hypothetical protein
MSDLYNDAQKHMKYAKDNAGDMVEQGKKEIKKSGKDWLDYVQDHPVQSMFFGLVIYFAAKGFIKD